MTRRVSTILVTFVLAASYLFAPGPAIARDVGATEYDLAKAYYQSFLEVPRHHKYRDKWLTCANKFLRVQKKYPKHWRADDAMYMAGLAYRGLYKHSYLMDDLDTAIMTYRRLIQRYPKSNYADDGQFLIGDMYEHEKANRQRAYVEYEKVLAFKGDMAGDARAAMKRLKKYAPPPEPEPAPKPEPKPEPKPLPPLGPGGLVYLREVSHWSGSDYTRIVVHTDRKVDYEYRLLPENETLGKPRRLFVDLIGTVRHGDLPETIPLGDGLLRRIRTGQHTKNECRVVLDIESIQSYSVFALAEPYRVVIDVFGEAREDVPYDPQSEFDRIVLDAGHGGMDPGCAYHGYQEKHIALAIVKKVKEKLQSRVSSDVILTRDSDRFIPLEGRTALANKHRADLFVSIHLNASRNREATGPETYYLDKTRNEDSLALAAAENAVSAAAVQDLSEYIELGDVALRARIQESQYLAVEMQRTIVGNLTSRYRHVENRGVRSAPFYVLVGAQMPAILIETGFLSNRTEAKRLASAKYQDALADAIAEGIARYIDGYRNGQAVSVD